MVAMIDSFSDDDLHAGVEVEPAAPVRLDLAPVQFAPRIPANSAGRGIELAAATLEEDAGRILSEADLAFLVATLFFVNVPFRRLGCVAVVEPVLKSLDRHLRHVAEPLVSLAVGEA